MRGKKKGESYAMKMFVGLGCYQLYTVAVAFFSRLQNYGNISYRLKKR